LFHVTAIVLVSGIHCRLPGTKKKDLRVFHDINKVGIQIYRYLEIKFHKRMTQALKKKDFYPKKERFCNNLMRISQKIITNSNNSQNSNFLIEKQRFYIQIVF
jgi:hypothetical protein